MNQNNEIKEIKELEDKIIEIMTNWDRANFNFCTVCGKEMDLPWLDIHLPYCQKCRIEMNNRLKKLIE